MLQGGESAFSVLIFEMENPLSNEKNRLENNEVVRRLRVWWAQSQHCQDKIIIYGEAL